MSAPADGMTSSAAIIPTTVTTALAVPEASPLALNREPMIVLEEARKAAVALKDVIDKKKRKVMFNDEQYLEFEDWATLGRFYGIVPRVPESGTRYVEYGGAHGWEAYAEAVHVGSGLVVSSASSMCLDDEENWGTRTKYAWVYVKRSGGTSIEDPGKDELIWDQPTEAERKAGRKARPKRVRELVGEEKVPQFQLRSMAQTRAGAKCMRNALAWIAVLAGYRPTPAEEMPGQPDRPSGPPRAEDADFRPPAQPDAPGAGTPDPPPNGSATPAAPEAAEAQERNDLLAEWLKLGNDLRLKGETRAKLWVQHCGENADPRTVDIAALQALVAAVRPATKSPA